MNAHLPSNGSLHGDHAQANESPRFDVFLSHNSEDKRVVTVLAERLRDEVGLQVFLDIWVLQPGQLWQDELAAAIENSGTTVVIYGPNGKGPWHRQEVELALDKAVQSPDTHRVVSVILPGGDSDDVDRFSRLRTWIEFRGGIDDSEAFQRLVAVIRGEATETGGITLPDSPAPYCGLDRFEAEQREFFFGRDEDIDNIVAQLSAANIVMVVGASGSGKSSVVSAGVVPRLADGAIDGSKSWHTLRFVPDVDPYRSLARELASGLPQGLKRNAQIQDLVQQLSRPDGIHTTLCDWFAESDEPILLIVDQFEELFTHTANQLPAAEQRKWTDEFLQNLDGALEQKSARIRLIGTLRADFVPRCLEFPILREILQEHQFLLGDLSELGLRDAIVRPAQAVGAFFEKGLVDLILRDFANQDGSLPLLQQALYELWCDRRGPWLTHDAYQDIGGVTGALDKRAQDTYDYRLKNNAQRQIARSVFLRLTTLGHGVSDTRRRVRRGELELQGVGPDAVDQVLEILSRHDVRLIRMDADRSTRPSQEQDGVVDDSLIEVAHEALIQNWTTLRRWLDDNRELLRLHRRLTEDAKQWLSGGNAEDYLYRGSRLEEAEVWSADETINLNTAEMEFLQASRDLRDAEIGKEKWRRRILTGLMAASLVFAVGAGYFAIDASRKQAEATRQARLSDARRLATESQAVRLTFPERSLLLACEAITATSLADDNYLPIAESALRGALHTMSGEKISANLIASNRKGTQLATYDEQGRVHVGDFAGQQVPVEISAGPGVTSMAVEDGWLAVAFESGLVRLWNLDRTEEPIAEVPGQTIHHVSANYLVVQVQEPRNQSFHLWQIPGDNETELVEINAGWRAAISENRRWFAAAVDSTTASVWDLSDSSMPPRKMTDVTDCFPIAVGPRGRWLENRGDDKVYDVSTSEALALPDLANGQPKRRLISPDGRLLIELCATNESLNLVANLARVINLPEEGTRTTTLSGHTQSITNVLFTHSRLITVSPDRVLMWELDDFLASEPVGLPPAPHVVPPAPELPAPPIDESRVSSPTPTTLRGIDSGLSFAGLSRDQTLLFGTRDDHAVYVWNLQNPNDDPRILFGHERPVIAAKLSADGRWLVTSDGEQSRRWHLDDPVRGGEPWTMHGHKAPSTDLAFTPDASFLFSTGYVPDGEEAIWQCELGDQKKPRWTKLHPGIAMFGDLKVSPDGNWMVGHSSYTVPAVLWSLSADGPVLRSLALPKDYPDVMLNDAWISSDSRWLGGTDFGDGIRPKVWKLDGRTGKTKLVYDARETRFAMVEPTSRWMLTVDDDVLLHLWSLRGESPVKMDKVLPKKVSDCQRVCSSQDGRWWLLRDANDAHWLWDLSNPDNEPQEFPMTSDSVGRLIASSDGRWLLLRDGKSHQWELRTPSPSRSQRLALAENGAAIASKAFEADFTQDSRWVVGRGYSNDVHLWRVGENESPSPIVLTGHDRPVTFTASTSDDSCLVTGSSDGQIRLWGLRDPEAGGVEILAHQEGLTALEISPDDRLLATAGKDAVVKIWQLWLPGKQGVKRIQPLLQTARKLAGRELTANESRRYLIHQ